MDLDGAIELTLQGKLTGIMYKELLLKLREMTGKSESTIKRHLAESCNSPGKIYRENGKYYLQKPKEKHGILEQLSNAFEKRSIRKELERKDSSESYTVEARAYLKGSSDSFKKIIEQKEKENAETKKMLFKRLQHTF